MTAAPHPSVTALPSPDGRTALRCSDCKATFDGPSTGPNAALGEVWRAVHRCGEIVSLVLPDADPVPPMTQRTAPEGTVATLGHPANGCLVVKGRAGWRYVETGLPVADEDFRAGWDDYAPPTTCPACAESAVSGSAFRRGECLSCGHRTPAAYRLAWQQRHDGQQTAADRRAGLLFVLTRITGAVNEWEVETSRIRPGGGTTGTALAYYSTRSQAVDACEKALADRLGL